MVFHLLAKSVASYNYTFTDKLILSLDISLMFILFRYATFYLQYQCISNQIIFSTQPLSQRNSKRMES